MRFVTSCPRTGLAGASGWSGGVPGGRCCDVYFLWRPGCCRDEAALSEGSVTCPCIEGSMGKTVLTWGIFI